MQEITEGQIVALDGKKLRRSYDKTLGKKAIYDVVFREDDCRVRQGHAAQNLAVLRHIALNLLPCALLRKTAARTDFWVSKGQIVQVEGYAEQFRGRRQL